MKKILAIIAAASLSWGLRAEDAPLPKLVFTHAMGMMPGVSWWGANGMFPLNDYARTKDVQDFALIYGGSQRIAPLGFYYAFLRKDSTYDFNQPYMYWFERRQAHLHPDFIPYDLSHLENRYLWDLRAAEEMGIDGFGLCLSGNEPSHKHAVSWFKTLEKILQDNPVTGLRLTIAICGDDLPSPEKPEKYAWLRRFMAEFKDSPAWLRHHGRIVLMGYHNQITWSAELSVDPEYMKDAIAVNQRFIQSLDAGDPVFIFDGPEYVPGQITHSRQPAQPELLQPIAAMVAEAFDGYSCWGGVIPDAIYPVNYRVIADEVQQHGKAWMMPIVNIHSGVGQFYASQPGIQRFLDTWRFADASKAQMVQLVTWNDTAEATGFQPSISLNYAFSSLTARFIHRFKHGVFPKAETDSVYLFYRKYHPDADPYLYPRATVERDANRWGETDDLLHVLVFAAADGVIELFGTSEGAVRHPIVSGYNEFKLQTAVNQEIGARIYRDNAIVHELVSPERVTDRPYREDLIPWGWSSDCRPGYDRDFGPDFRPISFYSQRYNDGIPDWFRLHYFGTTELPRGGAATADPDGDGTDNLNEYLSGESPLAPNPVYEAGFRWDELPRALSVVTDQPYSVRINQNPYPDKNGKLVHTFLYQKDGELDGNYPHMMKWVNTVPGTKTGWTLRTGVKHHYYLTADRALGMDLMPGWAGIYRFWSPVAGRIRIDCRLIGDPKSNVDFFIKQRSQELHASTCAAGQTTTAELELTVDRRHRIDFIVRAVGTERASIVLSPDITLIQP